MHDIINTKKQNMKPLILISNDDGYDMPGINYLASVARQWGDVIVVAPDGPRSGASLSVTFQRPLSARIVRQETGLTVYACNGTPTDCVKLAISQFCPRRPDLVLGGINHGDNSAVNVHYSGTMGVVIEGCLKGIPSVGFSYCSHSMDIDFQPMRPYIDKVLEYVLAHGLPQGVCLNVNAPDANHYRGMKLCSMGSGLWKNELACMDHPRGGKYYWLVGEFDAETRDTPSSDFRCLKEGYITITPTKTDVTAWEAMNELAGLQIEAGG